MVRIPAVFTDGPILFKDDRFSSYRVDPKIIFKEGPVKGIVSGETLFELFLYELQLITKAFNSQPAKNIFTRNQFNLSLHLTFPILTRSYIV